jgi:hypothetical protein
VTGFAVTIQNVFAYDPLLILRLIVTAFCFYVLYEVYVYLTGRGKQYLGVVNLIERVVELFLSGIGKALFATRGLPSDDDERSLRGTVRRNSRQRD